MNCISPLPCLPICSRDRILIVRRVKCRRCDLGLGKRTRTHDTRHSGDELFRGIFGLRGIKVHA